MSAPLIREIRALEEETDDRFDLAGYTKDQADALMKACFTDAFATTRPVRVTFIMGGGKSVRSRYDEDLGKFMATALREIGFSEDRSAALGDAGVFKQQHDIGQNLMYMHVFPKITKAAPATSANGGSSSATSGAGSSGGSSTGGPGEGESASGLTENQTRVIVSEMPEFKKMVPSMIGSWAQKRRAATFMQETMKKLEDIESALAMRKALSPAEQALFELCTRDTIEEKLTWLQGEIKTMVAENKLTFAELDTAIQEISERIQQMEAELAKAKADTANPKAAKMIPAMEARIAEIKTKRASFDSRRVDAIAAGIAALGGVALARPGRGASGPSGPRGWNMQPLKARDSIREAHLRIAAIDKFEKEKTAGGRKLTPQEAMQVSQRDDLRKDLGVLLRAARGWWETDQEFNTRVNESIANAPSKKK